MFLDRADAVGPEPAMDGPGEQHAREGREALRRQPVRAVRAVVRRHRRLGRDPRVADHHGRGLWQGPHHRQPPGPETEREYSWGFLVYWFRVFFVFLFFVCFFFSLCLDMIIYTLKLATVLLNVRGKL